MSDTLPFKPGYTPIEGQRDMHEYGDNPHIILREFEVHPTTLAEHGVRSTEEYVGRAQELFKEVSEEYRIPVAPFRAVLTNEPYHFAFIVDRIPGQSFKLEQLNAMTPAQRQVAHENLVRTFRYAHYKVDSGEAFITDHLAGPEQYLYDDQESKATFVDVDPFTQASREHHFDRVSAETVLAMHVLNSAVLLAEDPEHLTVWRQRGQELISLICDRNNYTLLEEDREAVLDTALTVGGDFLREWERVAKESKRLSKNVDYHRMGRDRQRAAYALVRGFDLNAIRDRE